MPGDNRTTALPGTVCRAVIDHLRTYPPGTEMSSAELAHAIGQSQSGFGQYLLASIKAGMLARRMSGGHARWSLGHNADRMVPPPLPTPEECDATSVRHVSALAVPSVFALGDQRRAAPFSCAASTDGRLMIERHGRLIAELSNAERLLLLKTATSGVAL